MTSRLDQQLSVPFRFPVIFTDHVFSPDNATLHSALTRLRDADAARAFICIDSGIARAMPDIADKAASWCKAWDVAIASPPRIIAGGEAAKNDWAGTQELIGDMLRMRLDRHAYVIVVGGGAVQDAVGFAASLVHRGLRVIRVPTTSLAQCDGGVGVKNAVNFAGGKNAIGTFAPPFAVINDFQFLLTLPETDWRGGIAEAFKVAMIRDAGFLDFLCGNTKSLRERQHGPMRHLVQRCAELHLEHIRTGGDPFEMGHARPLDFGHWSAHKLELLSGFRISHGDAVAAGIALDSAYAATSGWISEDAFERIYAALAECGFPLWHGEMQDPALLDGLNDFKEHLGGELCVTFPDGLGRRREESQVSRELIGQSLKRLKQRAGRDCYNKWYPTTYQMPLTYCLNIHPGETWSENLAVLHGPVLAVRDLVSPGKSFPLGLRLSAAAAAELSEPTRLADFAQFLKSEALHVITVNAFPYGRFHGIPVKENVYAPDWRTPLRRDYTNQISTILAGLIAEGEVASISTVPCSWKPWINAESDIPLILDHLTSCVAHCATIEDRQKREIVLALEPEPGCMLETTSETIAFFEEHLLKQGAVYLSAKLRISTDDARAFIRRHLGVCLDTCHVAIQFEDPLEALRRYEAAGIRVPKVQLSSALLTDASAAAIDALRPFAEPTYMHQVKAMKSNGEILSWNDLPQALAELPASNAREVRTHFHVPLHFTGFGALKSTAALLTPEFLTYIKRNPKRHIEIETYTWDVLPTELRAASVEESIAAEFHWVEASSRETARAVPI